MKPLAFRLVASKPHFHCAILSATSTKSLGKIKVDCDLVCLFSTLSDW